MCSHMRSGEQMFSYVVSWGTTGTGHGSLLLAQILARISLSNLSSDLAKFTSIFEVKGTITDACVNGNHV